VIEEEERRLERERERGKERRRGERWQSQGSGAVTEKEKEWGVRMVDLSKVASEKVCVWEREEKERLGACGVVMRGKRRCGD
jgi:hypothetical protein